ncbi:tyrosine-type recombinase/integrase [uncultured Exiguobacterium sp.]|uniref:tyrosine-type recombinase/integrase n=1 Tax=uncultured Exiguobacterium sp. TaxID=202669 RepID=UPI0025D7A008|nr:tyrosine-type recombinase/integrase [uncultured Exiguobacterium sp.]
MESAKRISVVSIKLVKDSSILYRNRRIRSPKDSYEIFKDFLGEVDREYFVVICLDTKNQPTNINIAHIGSINSSKIEKMNIEVCQRHVNEWFGKLKNFRMVKAYAAKVLDFAIKRGYIQSNPFSLVDMPKPKKAYTDLAEEINENFYTREELIKFLSCLQTDNNFKAYALFRLLSFSGMRKGEALALKWTDLNFMNNEIKISKAISRGKNNQLYLKSTKTGTVRNIKMDDQTIQILKQWKKRQQEDLLILGFNTLNKDQLVFSNTKNEYLQPTKTRRWLVQIQQKYNLKSITTHGLRHTHCSLLFEAGASIKEVQDRLGHSDVKTTMDIYAHVTQKAKAEAIQKFENYINI